MLVRVDLAGICGTDVELFTGEMAYYGSGRTHHPLQLGHEWTGTVVAAGSGTDALRALEDGHVDVVFSDISMPGLDGMALARVISRFSVRPQIVFVTAHDQHAVDAFEVSATDYLVKPIREDRLAEAVRSIAPPR